MEIQEYSPDQPARVEVDAWPGPAVIEFGTGWCGHCKAAQPSIQTAFEGHDQLRHVKIEDGQGRALGRSFRVKLWPTLVFLKDGVEVDRVVRPLGAAELRTALDRILGS